MNCIVCKRPAHGICRFCGRGLCQDHFKERNFILDMVATESNPSGLRVLAVEKALFCGKCNPVEELISVNLDLSNSKSNSNNSKGE